MPQNNDTCQDEYDTPWKEILEAYFKDFMAFFLPVAHDGIDWQRGYEFLDTELARISREAKIGDRRMDKLVKVWQLDGDELWVLIHIEIQADREANFPARMYTYQYRAFDLQQRPVVSLAILADEEVGWRPSEYNRELWGTRLNFQFTSVKLLDYLENQTDLEKSNNPFAVVTMAHLQAKKTRNQTEDRYQAKWYLVRGLYQSGFNRQQVVDLFRFIDWVLHLPKGADERLRTKIVAFEESQKMPYISSVERIGKERGIQEGEARMLSRQLQRRFRDVPSWANDKIAKADLPTLEEWSLRILDAQSLEDIFGT